MNQCAPALDDPDRGVESFDDGNFLAAQDVIAIHVRRGDEEIGVVPLLRTDPMQAVVRPVFEGSPLAADCDGVVVRGMLRGAKLGAGAVFLKVGDCIRYDIDPVIGIIAAQCALQPADDQTTMLNRFAARVIPV